MTLVIVLIMPAPLAHANSGIEETVVENTTTSTPISADSTEASSLAPGSAKTDMTPLPEAQLAPSSQATSAPQPDHASSQPRRLPAAQPVEQSDALKRTNTVSVQLVISKVSTDQKYIELYNPTTQSINLAGWRVEYITKTGKITVAKTFSSEHEMTPGGFLLLSSNASLSHSIGFDRTPGLAKDAGTVRLIQDSGMPVDVIGWGDAALFEGEPTVGSKGDFWRCFTGGVVVDSDNNRMDIMSHVDNSSRSDDRFAPFIKPACSEPKDSQTPEPEPVVNLCKGLKLSEIAANSDEQFIEVMNITNSTLDITGCSLMTNRHKTNSFVFEDARLKPQGFLSIKIKNTKLKLSKTDGEVYLLNSANHEIDSVEYKGLVKDSSWALVNDSWVRTYSITPDSRNSFKEFADCQAGYHRNTLTGKCNKNVVVGVPAPCPAGQYRNPETGRCKKIDTAKKVTPCKDGYYRNEATGRCRSIAGTAAKALKPCADDQFRNPKTGRCKKIAADSDVLKECAEGYERNPKTKRCRKIKTASVPMAGFAPERVKSVAGETWGWWIAGGVGVLALGYAGWQWRWEVGRFISRIAAYIPGNKK